MLGWLKGNPLPAEPPTPTGDACAISEVEAARLVELPDTPAPIFAVRAFQTALFGTPHPVCNENSNREQPIEANDIPKEKTLPSKPSHPLKPEISRSKESTCGAVSQGRINLNSPSKGILLTPGTAATRRKNVSFGGLGDHHKGKNRVLPDSHEKIGSFPGDLACSSIPVASLEHRPCQSKLTKTLFEARSEATARPPEISAPSISAPYMNWCPAGNYAEARTAADAYARSSELNIDSTFDLNQPRSLSGQHWKVEYERYHERSDREMKEIIKYSQATKSYAEKKDIEALELGAKLRKQLSKMISMEARVSNLAAQLAVTHSHHDHEPPDSKEVVAALGKQTASAVRWKQRAERSQAVLRRRNNTDKKFPTNHTEGETVEIMCDDSIDEVSKQISQDAFINPKLKELSENAAKAAAKAVDLEHENQILKKKLSKAMEEIGRLERMQLPQEKRQVMDNQAEVQAPGLDYEGRLVQVSTEQKIDTCGSGSGVEVEESNMKGEAEALIPTSRMNHFGNARSRSPIPPDRATAAKARLEQRKREKRTIRETGKGNLAMSGAFIW